LKRRLAGSTRGDEDSSSDACGLPRPRSKVNRYNITAAKDLEEGVARLAEYLKLDQTRDKRLSAEG